MIMVVFYSSLSTGITSLPPFVLLKNDGRRVGQGGTSDGQTFEDEIEINAMLLSVGQPTENARKARKRAEQSAGLSS